jgi:hypothetical protein
MHSVRDLLKNSEEFQHAKALVDELGYAGAARSLSKKLKQDISKSQLRHYMLRRFATQEKAKKGETKCKNADIYKATVEPKCLSGNGCDVCWRKWREAEKYREQIASELEPLPGKYVMPGGTTWGKENDVQKKQEYDKNMGKLADALHEIAGGGTDRIKEEGLSTYLSNLAEDERRFINRRRARAVSIAVARDILSHRHLMEMATRYFKGRIQASGYALKTTPSTISRKVNALFTDLHIGARLLPVENPEPFAGLEEGRRLAHVTRELVEFKTQYRNHTSLNLLLNGDVIDGFLEHQQYLMDNAPMAEMKLAFLHYFAQILALCAKHYPKVDVWCQPGNHGRDKVRHEGRATSWKWDGMEWELYKILEMMSCDLKNVTFHVPKAQVCIIPVFDQHILQTHGDTELKLSNPDTGGAQIEKEINRVNASRIYGPKIDLLAFGHFHKPHVWAFKSATAVAGPALVPPNGHARSNGWDTRCGQYIWESVPGFVWGDNRFVEVGPKQDKDETLDDIVKPFPYES